MRARLSARDAAAAQENNNKDEEIARLRAEVARLTALLAKTRYHTASLELSFQMQNRVLYL